MTHPTPGSQAPGSQPLSSQPLGYQAPGQDARVRVRDLLQLQTVAGTGVSVLKLLAGVALCLFIASSAAGVIQGLLVVLGVDVLPAWLVLLVVGGGLLAVLFWTERRYRGQWYAETSRGETAPDGFGRYSSSGEMDLLHYQAMVKLIVESMLLGPRLVLEGACVRQKIADPALVDRAVEVVVRLAEADGAVPLRQLLAGPQDVPALKQALGWLQETDWIDRSADGRRAWLLSTRREQLIRQA